MLFHGEMSYGMCYTTLPVCSYYCSTEVSNVPWMAALITDDFRLGISFRIPSSSQSDFPSLHWFAQCPSKLRNGAFNSIMFCYLSPCVTTTTNGLYSSGIPLSIIAMSRLSVTVSPAFLRAVAAVSSRKT